MWVSASGAGPGVVTELLAVQPEIVLTPREAYFAAEESVPVAQASGRISVEAITHAAGNPVSSSDPTMELVQVVA